MFATLSNRLTMLRVVLVPLLVALFFVPGDAAHWGTLAVFVVAAATDWLDGHLARARRETTRFGQFLDPIADKVLVLAALVMLAAFDRMGSLAAVAVVIILCRELLISGLREFLSGRDVPLPVLPLAKWKTAAQMVAIGFLLVGTAAPAPVPAATIGEALLWIAAVLSLITAWEYLRASLPVLLAPEDDDEDWTEDGAKAHER